MKESHASNPEKKDPSLLSVSLCVEFFQDANVYNFNQNLQRQNDSTCSIRLVLLQCTNKFNVTHILGYLNIMYFYSLYV